MLEDLDVGWDGTGAQALPHRVAEVHHQQGVLDHWAQVDSLVPGGDMYERPAFTASTFTVSRSKPITRVPERAKATASGRPT